MFARDTRLELLYPIHTHVKDVHDSNVKTRHLIVHSVRDLVHDPLTLTEFCRRPFVARSRYMIRAWDIDLQAWRNFYLGTSPQFRAPGSLRIALYDPDGTAPAELVGRQFDPTPKERLVMLRLIERLTRSPSVNTPPDRLRVIADDLSIHSGT